jgi:hypothetical protein
MLALHNAHARDRRLMATDRLEALSLVLHEEFSTPFLFYDGATGEPIGDGDAGELATWPLGRMPAEVLAIAAQGRPHVSPWSCDHFRLVLPIRDADGSTLVAIGELPALARSVEAGKVEQARLLKWLQSVHSRVASAGGSVAPHRTGGQLQIQQLKPLLEASKELTGLLTGLESLGETIAQQSRVLRRIAAVLPAAALIWVPPQAEEDVVTEGGGGLCGRGGRDLARWLSQRPDWDLSGSLILNDALSCGLAAKFPGIVNLMAVAVGDKQAGGWLIVLNKRDDLAGAGGPDIVPFRLLDVALLKPFASLLGLQSRSVRRQSEVQDLFAGLIQSLTAAIDAKDSYTCGHSERVARVAVELGREMGLSESELGDVYLAGLLHDIGKIGIPDSVLGKPGSLTSEEFTQIAQHVLIGCRILEGFRGISHLLPVVLSHHERYDGSGYPRGLKGEEIPRLARILAVADCYDAMNTALPAGLGSRAGRGVPDPGPGSPLGWGGHRRLLPDPGTDLHDPPARDRRFGLVRSPRAGDRIAPALSRSLTDHA